MNLRQRPQALAWCAVAGLHVAVAVLHGFGPVRRPLGDEVLYRGAAEQLLATGTMDLSPLWPPLYVVFLALLRWLGQGWALVPWAQWGLLLLSAVCMRRLGRRLLGRGPGDWAAILWLAYPPLVAFSHYFWPEVLHLTLMLGLVELMLRERRDARAMTSAGLLAGLAVATKALLTPWLPVLLWWAGRPTGSPAADSSAATVLGRWRPMAWFGLGMVGVMLPLMAWNAQRVGVFALSDSAAFNLWVGLEDTSKKSFVDGVAGPEYRAFLASGETFEARQEVLRGKIRQRFQEHGVVAVLTAQFRRQYWRLFDKDSYFTDQLPGGVIAQRGQGYRQRPAALTSTLRAGSYLFYGLLLVAACLGWVVTDPRRRPWLYGVALFLLYNLGLFLLLHVKSRYRIQMLPGVVLYATCGLTWLRLRLTGQTLPEILRGASPDTPIAPWRWWIGASAAVALLVLALGAQLP